MAGEHIAPRGSLMQGKRGVIMGVANDHSIAWGIARTLARARCELAFTYQGDALGRRVEAESHQKQTGNRPYIALRRRDSDRRSMRM